MAEMIGRMFHFYFSIRRGVQRARRAGEPHPSCANNYPVLLLSLSSACQRHGHTLGGETRAKFPEFPYGAQQFTQQVS